MTLDPVPVDGLILVAAGLMVIGVLFVGASERLRVPAALISLAIGIVFGSDVLGVVDLDDMALVRDLSIVALMIILFEGGLTTKPSVLRESGVPGFVLANVGVLVTAGITAAGIQLLFRPGWETALTIGALVGSRLGDNPPPPGMLVTTVIRDNRASIPNAETVFVSGDVLMLAVDSEVDRITEVTAWARGETQARSEPDRP